MFSKAKTASWKKNHKGKFLVQKLQESGTYISEIMYYTKHTW